MGVSFGDASDGVAALAGALAALFALMSLRQVRELTRASEARDARLATLNLLSSAETSLGHLSQPLETALAERADAIATALMPRSAGTVAFNTAKASIIQGRLLDLAVPLDAAALRTLADWKTLLSAVRKEEVATYLNRLEETCTSVLRATLDLRTIDKMYGTLIRETYREAAQLVYYYRRTGSYRYFDQLEYVVDRLTTAETQLFRVPQGLGRLRLALKPGWRRLLRHLDTYSEQQRIDSAQLEGALLSSGLIAQEEVFRSRLEWRSTGATFRKIPDRGLWWWRRRPAADPTHEVVDTSGARLATVSELPLGSGSAVIVLGIASVDLDLILARLPRDFFHPEHLATRTAAGAFSGAPAIYVCSLEANSLLDADLLRGVLRSLKRELNTGRLRPFALVATSSDAELTNAQPIMHSEGGMVLHVHRASSASSTIWLF